MLGECLCFRPRGLVASGNRGALGKHSAGEMGTWGRRRLLLGTGRASAPSSLTSPLGVGPVGVSLRGALPQVRQEQGHVEAAPERNTSLWGAL